MRLNRLTAVKVQQVRYSGLYADGGGLHLQVTQGSDGKLNKSWLFRFSIRDGRISHVREYFNPVIAAYAFRRKIANAFIIETL